MAQINKPDLYFNTKLYTGTGSSNALTGVGFQPDFTWIKNRSTSEHHILTDSVRGAPLNLYSNLTNAENNTAEFLKSFDSDGFTVGTSVEVNGSSNNMASWNWLANGAGSANTDGSISSTVSANTTSGFSIVSYTGTNATGTVGHGLGSTPKVVIYKNRTDVTNWYFTTTVIDGSNDLLFLNTTEASQTFSAPVPTGSLLNLIANNDTNGSGDNIIAYCFAEKQGFSKFGSYTGNASTDGTFVYTGFKPAFFLFKRTDAVKDWHIIDAKRDVDNPTQKILYPNLSDAEATPTAVDFVSNGIKIRNGGSFVNEVNGTYIYMAFAEEPLVGDNPATAR